tara:strand:+ start:1122 stop:1412 length:291 start_codon:yes stop_codon:yes gene_type:complete
MSPNKNRKLNKLRKKLDTLDNSLLILIKERTEIVKKVLELKKFKYEIVDNKRIKTILKRVKKRSKMMKIDPKITERIWINMIRSYIDFEKRNFKNK